MFRRHFSASVVVSVNVDVICLFRIVLLSKVVGKKAFRMLIIPLFDATLTRGFRFLDEKNPRKITFF